MCLFIQVVVDGEFLCKNQETRIPLLLLLLSRCGCCRCSRVRLCGPMGGGPPGSPSLGFSRQEHWSGLPVPSPVHACMLSRFSHIRLCSTLWTAAHRVPLSTGFSRQEYWSGFPFPSPCIPLCFTKYGARTTVAAVKSQTATRHYLQAFHLVLGPSRTWVN